MDEPIEKDDNAMHSSSKLEYIMADPDYCIKEKTLDPGNVVQETEVKNELNYLNDELTNDQHQNETFKVNIKSECNIEIKEEIFETNSLKDNFVEVSKIKSEFSEPSDEYSNSQKLTGPVNHSVFIKHR